MQKIIAHLIKSKSYKSDGRLLKWVGSLSDSSIKSEVFILEDANQRKESTDGTVKITSTSLFFRKYFKKHKGYFFKIPEFTYKSLKYFKKSKACVFIFHDVQHYLTLLLICFIRRKGKNKRKIVWDLHELPHASLATNPLSRIVVKFILNKVDLVIYTNEERRKWILKKFKHNETKYVILNNFPSKHYILGEIAPMPQDLAHWLMGKPFVLWMGAATKNRNFLPVLESLTKFSETIKLVVMGSIDEDVKTKIRSLNLESFVYSKFVSQEEIICFVDNCLFSIVFYKQTSPNNTLCEPNRLYQLISRKIPVIVGNNPPMAQVVEAYQAGIVLRDDGSNTSFVDDAIEKMLDRQILNRYRKNLNNITFAEIMCWENQFNHVISTIEKL